MKRLNLNLSGVIAILAAGVLLPVLLSTAVGIVAISLADGTKGIVTGVLVISFAVTAAGCCLLALVFASRKSRLARQQADFLAGISHEFRTPLSSIKLYAQTLQSGDLSNDPEQTARCIETILREVAWLDSMIDRILTWRVSSSDMLVLDKSPLNTDQAISTAIEKFTAMVHADEVTFTSDIRTRAPVEHDMKALSAVILNLLTNAYKYSGKQKTISVTAYDNDTSVVIEVCDNGIGISVIDMKRIFKPFFRAHHDSSGGVGLGLAIANHLIEMHNGSISVSSNKDQGSTFTITLPIAENCT